eukprot:scaffold7608_cov67-Attheya_sp.AAC.11
MVNPPSKHCKPGHGTHITDCTRSAKHNTKTTYPDIKPQAPHAPYPLLPNLPPSTEWMSKLKHIHKPRSIPITYSPSMTCNAKSKSKSMNDDLDEAATSDLVIFDSPSISKSPSETTKPKPKSVSDPQNDNDTNKEAWKADKIACNKEKQRHRVAKQAAKEARKQTHKHRKSPNNHDSNSLSTTVKTNTYENRHDDRQNNETGQANLDDSNKHKGKENNNDKNGYDNDNNNEENGHVNDDKRQKASVPPFQHNFTLEIYTPFLSMMLHQKMPLYPLF